MWQGLFHASRRSLRYLSAATADRHHVIFWGRMRMSSLGDYCGRERCLKQMEALLQGLLGGSPRSLHYLGPIVDGGELAAPSPRTRLIEGSRRGTFNATFNVSVGLFAVHW